MDRLSKKVAQNDRTFFTYLAGQEYNSLFRFLSQTSVNEFHYVGINEIYDYFEQNIKAVQSDETYEWYKRLQGAYTKGHLDEYTLTQLERVRAAKAESRGAFTKKVFLEQVVE